MTLSPRNLSLLTLIQVAAVGACGTAADGDYNGEELFKVQGSITGTPENTPTAAQAALIWVKPSETSIGNLIGEGVAVNSVFPANFAFDLYSAPEESTMFLPENFDDIGGMEFAMASILAFDDVNGDNTLTITGDETGIEGPDQIIGVAQQDFVLYVRKSPTTALEGIPNPEELVPGFYIMHFPCDDGDCPVEIYDEDFAVDIVLTPPSNLFPTNFPFMGSGTSGGGDGEGGGDDDGDEL